MTNYSPYIWGYYQDQYGVNWVTDSAYDTYGDKLYYTAYTDTFLSSPAFDLSLINAPFLSVNIFHDLPYNWVLGSYDLLIFEASIDNGISWIPIGLPRYGTTLYPGQIYAFPLYRFQGQSSVKIRFRLKSDGIYQGDGVYISDFEIVGKSPSFIYTGTEYQWNEGTSFATPIVSGVAAMLLSHRPELSTQDVRKIILQSVTKVDGLADKVASGGIVNAYEAIKLADAWEIETSTPDNNSWSSANNLGNGWRSFSWFGEFFEVSENWIYHMKMGWLYRFGDDLNLLWFYSPQHGWLFTSKSIYPYLYKHSIESWLYSSDNKFLAWNGSKWNSI